MQAPEWASFISNVDGSLNSSPLRDLDQVLLKEVIAENCGLPLFDLAKRSPVLHMQHTCSGEPVAQSPDALAQPASDTPLSHRNSDDCCT